MRKLILLVAVVVLAVLVLILARTLGSPGSVAPLPPEQPPQARASSPTALDPKRGAEVDRTPARPVGHETATDNANSGSLRVRIAFANQPDHQPQELQVRVSDLLGVQRDAHSESPLEFVVPVLALGEYVVVADEESAIGAAVHAKLTERGKETLVEIVLEAKTKLQVRWKSTDGTPIVAAIGAHLDDGLHRSLAVYASRAPMIEAGPPPASVAIASILQEFGATVERDSSFGGVHGELASRADKTAGTGSQPARIDSELFGELNVPASAPFFVSAWSGGALIETQRVERNQHEVVFTTTLEQVTPVTVSLKLCVVDEETGQPRSDASVWASGETRGIERTEEQVASGCHELEVEQGLVTLHIDPSTSPDISAKAPKFVSITRELRVWGGHPVDLGSIGVSRPRKATYHVVDAAGKSVEGAEFAIVRMSSYDGGAEHGELRRVWSDHEGLLAFDDISPEPYAIACSSPRIDATPFVIDGTHIAVGDERIVGDIVLRPVRQISFVFDEPPRVGTLMMIETTDGLPVRALEMDEFGIVPVWLGGTDYRTHLVEDGVVTVSVPFTVNSDPCILRIQR